MRFIWFVIFLILVAIIGVFAYENSERVPINYLDQNLTVQSIHLPMSAMIGGIYVLGMLTGWTVVGFLKRTVQHVTEGRRS